MRKAMKENLGIQRQVLGSVWKWRIREDALPEGSKELVGAGEADGVGLQRKGAPDRGKEVARGYPETVSRPWGSINMQKRLGQQ